MADATANPGFHLSLGARLFLATALLVALAVGAAVVVTHLLGRQVARDEVEQALTRSSSVQAVVQQQRLERLRLVAQLFAGDPYFTAYVQESIALGDGLSLQDQIDDRRSDLSFDFAAILDADGQVVVRTDTAQAKADDLSDESLVVQALENYQAVGVWAKDGQLYDAVAVPLEAGGVLVGYLITAFGIDEGVALELRRIGGTEVAFATFDGERPTLVTGTLDTLVTDALASEIAKRPAWFETGLQAEDAPPPTTLSLDGRSWLVLVNPFYGAGGEIAGAVLSLASLDQQLAPYQRIGAILTGVGLGAILLASLLSFFLARRVLRPVRELVAATQAAAEGDYDREIADRSRDEVGRLGTAFKRLLNELREKRDMEVYITELARNLPEPDLVEAGAPKRVPPESRDISLLGIELRRSAPASTETLEIFDDLNQQIRRAANAVAGQSGKLEAVVGHRLLASFDGPKSAQRALSAGATLLTRSGELGPAAGAGPALALVTGEAVRGSLTWSEHPQIGVTGAPVHELESLLRGARPGDILLSQRAYAALVEVFSRAGLELRQHTLAKTLPLYLLNSEMAARVTHHEMEATRELGTVAPSAGGAQLTLGSVGPGSVIDDRFVVLKELGVGGMGIVFKARDRELDELVALKMLKPGVWRDEKQLEQLKAELKIARRISHPNVVSTFDYGDFSGAPFISMEYVRGITLRQSLDQSGQPPYTAGLRLARQLCRGLSAAHAQGVLHRDIKPENLLIEPTGNVKLMDFGIAQPVRRGTGNTDKGMLVGTPFYLAPEQLEGKEPDERVDIYACGVVFYEIFTGQLPFETTGSLMQVLSRKAQKDATPAHAHWPEIPAPLEAILARCLERDPGRRYRTVEVLLADLEQLRG